MPMDYSRYPDNWKEISQSVRDRAGQECEWCGVKNGAIGARDKDGQWWDENQIDSMNSAVGESHFGYDYPKIIRIVLTVAHLGIDHVDGTPGDKNDKRDCRPENLAALCQRCHLNFDREDNLARRKLVRAGGQLALEITPAMPKGI